LISISGSTNLQMFSKIGLPVLELWPLKYQFLPILAFSAIIFKFIEDRRSIVIANLNSMTRSIFLESDYRCWSHSLWNVSFYRFLHFSAILYEHRFKKLIGYGLPGELFRLLRSSCLNLASLVHLPPFFAMIK
jgi:hypothetical protein